jgi:hypothetical protein
MLMPMNDSHWIKEKQEKLHAAMKPQLACGGHDNACPSDLDVGQLNQ